MLKKISHNVKIYINLLIVLVFFVFLGFICLAIVYSLPINDRIITNVDKSIDLYSSDIIIDWVGGTRYAHLSNTMDFGRLNEAVCRPFDLVKNVLLNPHYVISTNELNNNFVELIKNGSLEIGTYSRYWHGYLTIIIPCLLFTHSGGIRMISLFVQFIIIILLLFELGKRNKFLMLFYSIVILFINPITTVLSFQEANIFIISSITSIIILKYNNFLIQKNRYVYLFFVNGIFVSYFDYLTYPLVAWGLPITTFLLINVDFKTYKKYIRLLIKLSLCWLFGYAGMWLSKWILASIITNENVLLDAYNNIVFRTVGENVDGQKILFVDVLKKMWESINDVPMLLLYLIGLVLIVIFIHRNKSNFHHLKLLSVIPLFVVSISPFVWYFVLKNHSFIHPWMEYRELVIVLWSVFTIIYKLFEKSNYEK